MAKKKIKFASAIDMSEKEVEVEDGVHVELPLPPEAILGRPDARDEVTAKVEALAKRAKSAPVPAGCETLSLDELEKAWNALPPGKMMPYRPEDEASRYGGYELRKLPEGMNKYNSTNEWLMLILESLYRIERKLGA